VLGYLIAGVLMSAVPHGAEAPQAWTAEFRERWATARAFTLAVAELMPEEDYRFKPSPEVMAFGALMHHIAIANLYRVSQVAGEAYELPQGPLPAGKAATLESLAASFDRCDRLLAGLTAEKLDATYDVAWEGLKRATGRQVLQGMLVHTAHHRGQAEVYLRLKGIKPPVYRY
jgi:uncharacterized damage-inducible protein DinB